jgi:hypothetical protein
MWTGRVRRVERGDDACSTRERMLELSMRHSRVLDRWTVSRWIRAMRVWYPRCFDWQTGDEKDQVDVSCP